MHGLLGAATKEMKTAYDAFYQLLACDLFGIFNNIANASMGTACDDINAIAGAVGQCRIIQHIVTYSGILKLTTKT